MHTRRFGQFLVLLATFLFAPIMNTVAAQTESVTILKMTVTSEGLTIDTDANPIAPNAVRDEMGNEEKFYKVAEGKTFVIGLVTEYAYECWINAGGDTFKVPTDMKPIEIGPSHRWYPSAASKQTRIVISCNGGRDELVTQNMVITRR